MKILVLGSHGFIGSKVFAFYSNRKNVEVWGCDIVVAYGAKNYIVLDTNSNQYENVFDSRYFDVCINCIGAASVPDSGQNPLRDYYLNTKIVFDVLDAIRKFSPSTKFLNLSSAAVYGNPVKLPVNEMDTLAPLSPYGWHKYQSELICKEFYQIYDIRTCSLRVFSAYGPGLKKQLFWDWHEKIQTSSHIELYGTGRESRDFIFIDDLVNAIDVVVENANFLADTINIGNGKEVYIEEAIKVFEAKSKLSFSYVFNNQFRKGDPLNWCADISTLLNLGYKQKVNFESGIEQFNKWLESEK